jgi:hypothetical protein
MMASQTTTPTTAPEAENGDDGDGDGLSVKAAVSAGLFASDEDLD